MKFNLRAQVLVEFLGTASLVAAVIGSGIMGERLAGGNAAIALLANTLATGAALVVLILTFGPVSGAHLNPVVTLSMAWRSDFGRSRVAAYLTAQFLGAFAGAATAHAMFGLAMFSISIRSRYGAGQLFSEFVATFGLLAAIWGCTLFRPSATPYAVGAYITAAYWFTASTSFANPAVTVARATTNTFAGIRPRDTPAFLAAQLLGALAATVLFRWLAANQVASTRKKISPV